MTNLKKAMQFFDAVEHEDIAEVNRLIDEDKSIVNATDARGRTALMAGFRVGVKVIKILLDAGANVNAVDNSGTTALMYVVAGEQIAKGEQVEVGKMLIDAGADVNVRSTSRDETVWDIATPEVTRELKEHLQKKQ